MDILAPGMASAAVLVSTRAGGLLLVAPAFSSKSVPVSVRTAFLVVLTCVLTPLALHAAATPPRLSPAALVGEALIGFTIGMGAALFVAAAEAMGDLLGMQIGLSGAASLDPVSFASTPVLSQFANLFALVLILALDGHLVMLEALAASTRLLPLGAPVDVEAGAAALVAAAGLIFALGFQFAAPVVATVVIANLALGILTRAAPQLQVLSVAFPLQIGVGLLTLSASIPLVGAFFVGWEPVYTELLMRLFSTLAGER